MMLAWRRAGGRAETGVRRGARQSLCAVASRRLPLCQKPKCQLSRTRRRRPARLRSERGSIYQSDNYLMQLSAQLSSTQASLASSLIGRAARAL